MSNFVSDAFAMPSQSLDPNRKRGVKQSLVSRRERKKKWSKYQSGKDPYVPNPTKIHGPTTTA